MMSVLAQLTTKTNPLMQAALNLIYPPRCVSCGCDVANLHSFCGDCFASLTLIDAPCCARCGSPFAYSLGENAVCSDCLQTPPPYVQARAAMHYDERSRKLITRLKYADKLELIPALAAQLWRVGNHYSPLVDYIIPVPLHAKRLRERKYNQSALLAHRFAQREGLPVLADGLLRVVHTPPQASLSRSERLKNVQKAFRTNHRHAKRLQGARILLIDDVITTGATIEACCKALLGAGVKEVYVLSAAKTVKDN